MMSLLDPAPGFLAVSFADLQRNATVDVGLAVRRVTDLRPDVATYGSMITASWGLRDSRPSQQALLLALAPRRGDRSLTPGEVGEYLRLRDGVAMTETLPTFGAVLTDDGHSLVAVTDALGFRHLYFCTGEGWSAVSTSSRALATLANAAVDRESIAVQSLLGWQLRERTMFSGVQKLAAGTWATLTAGNLAVEQYADRGVPGYQDPDEAVGKAATVLRDFMASYLDDRPEAVLQLTGGQDSRILLSAIPPPRRRGLKVMTLGVSGSADVEIAASIARRYGMVHQVESLEGLETLTPEEAYFLCLQASKRLECMADPLAFAALAWAESKFDQAPRLSGLGGEVARGFYYFGPTRVVPVNRRRTAQLANWRLFANEAVPAGSLIPGFAEWSREFTLGDVFDIMSETGLDWFAATDEFYLAQRMQRWAGITDTAVCFDREVVNPMLDGRFLNIARGLPPRSKRGARFLSRLQVELDDELASVPLDGRPPPSAFAHVSIANSSQLAMMTMGKVVRKARQKMSRQNRPPAGGELLAAKVVAHWRDTPDGLDVVRNLEVFDPEWLDLLIAGTAHVTPGSVALLVNLAVSCS